MRQILTIGHNDIHLFFKDKSSLIWLFALPLAFIFFTGFANRGSRDPYTQNPPVFIENLDEGFMGKLLMDEILAQGMYQVPEDKQDEAKQGIRIPSDFTRSILNLEQGKIEYFQTEGSREDLAAMIELRVFRALIRINSALFHLVSTSEEDQPVSEEGIREELAHENAVSLETSFAGRKPIPSGYNQSLPGNLVMFLMMNLLIFGGVTIAEERKNGVIRRLAIYPLRKWELIMGKVYGRFLLGAVQVLFFLLAGRFIFNVNVGDQILAIIVMLLVYVWVASSLGILIGSITRNPDQTVGLCILTSLMMAALGGCWWPMEIVPDTMQTVGHFFPTAWAMDGLHQLISFGGDFTRVTTEFGMLILFGVLANFGAAKCLRF